MPCIVKKAFEQATATGVHLIAQVKSNQPALHHAIATLCDTAASVDSTQTADKKRRCHDETRTVEVFAPGGSLADTEWDGHIRAIIRVNRDVLTRSTTTGLWRDTSGTALFVSDVVLPAVQCTQAIRDHWHIENRSHYIRDGSFAEDTSRIRCNPGIFARPRSFAANILRFNGIHNVSDGRIASPSAASVQSSPCASRIGR
jgi:predicted transposase YbfD/YdcC